MAYPTNSEVAQRTAVQIEWEKDPIVASQAFVAGVSPNQIGSYVLMLQELDEKGRLKPMLEGFRSEKPFAVGERVLVSFYRALHYAGPSKVTIERI